jgi:DNA-binding IclR family transcriptional regulator
MTVDLGRRWPLHAGSTGKAILAFASDDLRRQVLDNPMSALTTETMTDRDVLTQELEKIREQGYATSRGERQPGAASAAAPIFGPRGLVVGAVSLCGPADRVPPSVMAAFGHRTAEAADDVSRLLLANISSGEARDSFATR